MKSSTSTVDTQIMYSTILSAVVVPAREKYTVSFTFNCSIKKTASNSGSLVGAGFEFLDFGADPFPSSSFVLQGYTVFSSTVYSKISKGTTDYTGVTVSDTYTTTVTYLNDTDTDQTFNSRFAFRASKAYATQYANTLTATCAMSASVTVVDLVDIGTPQDVTQVFNGSDMLNPVDSIITNANWYYGSRIDLTCADTIRNVGTYTVNAALSSYALTENVRWITDPSTSTTATADQTFTFEVTKKPISYTLANVVSSPVYGVTDAGKVTASYTGVEASDIGTPHGPDIAIYYQSTDGYSHGKGADDDSGNGLGSLTVPTQAGKYKATLVDKNAATDNYDFQGIPLNFEIEPEVIPQPAINPSAAQPYRSSDYTFNLVYSGDYAKINISPDARLTYSTVATPYTFKVTDAGSYNVEFTLASTRNSCWSKTGGVYDTDPKTKTITINPASLTLAPSATGNVSGANWALGDAGSITLTPQIIGTDAVSLNLWYYDTGDPAHTPTYAGVSTSAMTLDVSQITAVGSYVLCAQLWGSTDSGYVPMNGNYTLTGGMYTYSFSVVPGSANILLTWQYMTAAMAAPDNIFEADGVTLKDLPYTFSSGAPLEYEVSAIVQTPNTALDTTKYTNGYLTYADGDSSMTPVSATAAGRYRTRIAIEITDPNIDFALTQRFSASDPKHGWVELAWTVEQAEIDLTALVWEYSLDNGATWINVPADNNIGYNDGKDIYVRIKESSYASTGLVSGDISYGGTDEWSSKGTYTTTATIAPSDSSLKTPTDPVELIWNITNARITVTGWDANGTLTKNGKALDTPTAKTADSAHSQYIKYVYTCTLPDGTPYSDEGYDALEYLNDIAKQNNVKISVVVTADSNSTTYDVIGTTLTQSFMVGEPKKYVDIDITGDGSEYGSVTFGVTAKYNGNAFSTSDYTIEIYGIGEDIDNLGTYVAVFTPEQLEDPSNYLGILNNAGTYVVNIVLSASAKQNKFAIDTPAVYFTIEQKLLAVPTLADVIFTGKDINLEDYLDTNYKAYKDGGLITIYDQYSGIRNVNTNGVYTATIEIINPNYAWDIPASTPAPAKHGRAAATYNVTADKVKIDWNIQPYVITVTESDWNLKNANGATLKLPAGVTSDMLVELGYNYYYNQSDTTPSAAELKSGDSLWVAAYLTGDDADNGNVVFADGMQTQKVAYTVPQSGVKAAAQKAVTFVKDNLLWVIIGAAAVLLLIFLIILIAHRRRTKEKREEKKAAKEAAKAEAQAKAEAEKERREAEKARLESQREIEKMKAEAEIAKIKAQAQQPVIPNGAQQSGAVPPTPAPQYQPMPQAMPSAMPPAQPPFPQQAYNPQMQPQAMPQASMPSAMPPAQPPYPQQATHPQMPAPYGASGGELAELKAEIAAMRSEQSVAKELAAMRAEQTAKDIALMRTEQNAKDIASLKTELEAARSGGHAVAAPVAAQSAPASGINDAAIEEIARRVAEKLRVEQVTEVKEESASVTPATPTPYPPDAVITTTTTVDTTKSVKQLTRTREETDGFADVDGFYEKYE